MCGRYALALRPSQVRRMLEDDGIPVHDAPTDEAAPSPHQTYNFAPGHDGIVYRADASRPRTVPMNGRVAYSNIDNADQVSPCFKLQSMKWGLVSSWMNRNSQYKTNIKTINCRADSLMTPGGMWAQIKGTNRCIVIAQGFFEWLKMGPKEKLPHFSKRDDGHLMCFAGLWDCVENEGTIGKLYTYTIITTDSNKQLSFLHDRMPVILEPGSSDFKAWLDPERREWSAELQSILRPFDGKLSVYPVNKEVGKVGNDSPSFVIPLDSKENKYNIVNMFAATSKGKAVVSPKASEGNISVHQVSKIHTEDVVPSQEYGTEQSSAQKRTATMMSGIKQESLSNKRREADGALTKPPQSKPQKITSFFSRKDRTT